MKKILCTVLAAALTLSLSVSACAKGLSGTVSTNGSTSMEPAGDSNSNISYLSVWYTYPHYSTAE